MNEKIERAENDSMTERDNLEWAKTRKKATLKDIKKHYCVVEIVLQKLAESYSILWVSQ